MPAFWVVGQDITFDVVHLFFLVVEVVEEDPDQDADAKGADAQTDIHPQDGRVVGGGHKGLAKGGAKGVGEQKQGLDKGLHARRGLCVGVLVARGRGKDLGDADQHVRGGLDGDVDVVALRRAG